MEFIMSRLPEVIVSLAKPGVDDESNGSGSLLKCYRSLETFIISRLY
jgi:hypothetical protein